MTAEKVAIVLMNLGGPSRTEDIRPFLFNFFMDKNIIRAPLPVRFLLARYISWKRGSGAALSSYTLLGGKSPLLENTKAQAEALQAFLHKQGIDCRVFVSMRYWHPMAHEVARMMQEYRPTRVILLPLYPQFSTTTTFSSFEDFRKYRKECEEICCYPVNRGFIRASADNIGKALEKAPAGTRLLFSAHGLPEKIVKGGDPYQWQCEQTAQSIVKELGREGLDWQICYQSRVGPLKWIGPSTEEALRKAAGDKVAGVLVYPHAFVSEHVETLVEIEHEYRDMAQDLGIPWFGRAETVGTHPDFISGLAALVLDRLKERPSERICPSTFKRCICKG